MTGDKKWIFIKILTHLIHAVPHGTLFLFYILEFIKKLIDLLGTKLVLNVYQTGVGYTHDALDSSCLTLEARASPFFQLHAYL